MDCPCSPATRELGLVFNSNPRRVLPSMYSDTTNWRYTKLIIYSILLRCFIQYTIAHKHKHKRTQVRTRAHAHTHAHSINTCIVLVDIEHMYLNQHIPRIVDLPNTDHCATCPGWAMMCNNETDVITDNDVIAIVTCHCSPRTSCKVISIWHIDNCSTCTIWFCTCLCVYIFVYITVYVHCIEFYVNLILFSAAENAVSEEKLENLKM
jgi:hypothetical protein